MQISVFNHDVPDKLIFKESPFPSQPEKRKKKNKERKKKKRKQTLKISKFQLLCLVLQVLDVRVPSTPL